MYIPRKLDCELFGVVSSQIGAHRYPFDSLKDRRKKWCQWCFYCSSNRNEGTTGGNDGVKERWEWAAHNHTIRCSLTCEYGFNSSLRFFHPRRFPFASGRRPRSILGTRKEVKEKMETEREEIDGGGEEKLEKQVERGIKSMRKFRKRWG